MNKERVKELQDHYMAFTSTSELEQIVISESVEVEAIEAARIELERRKKIVLSDPDNSIDVIKAKQKSRLKVWLISITVISGLAFVTFILFMIGVVSDGLFTSSYAEFLLAPLEGNSILIFTPIFSLVLTPLLLILSWLFWRRNKIKISTLLSIVQVPITVDLCLLAGIVMVLWAFAGYV